MDLPDILEKGSRAYESSLLTVVNDHLASHGVPAAWTIGSRADGWIHASKKDCECPSQGWKLHVSANSQSAVAVLTRVLPILFAGATAFKVAASLSFLDDLNEGSGGISQIGKFITIYPTDDASAVGLARALDGATNGLDGPVVPSDLPLRPGSLVHYRYGEFEGRQLQTPLGEIVSAIVTPEGALVPDRRLAFYDKPAWATDPFRTADADAGPAGEKELIGGRYLPICVIDESARGNVYLAVDVREPRRCVIKQARHGLVLGPEA